MSPAAMERKRKRDEVEYFERPPEVTQNDLAEEAQLETMLFGAANVEDFGNELERMAREEPESKSSKPEKKASKVEEEDEETKPNTIWIDKNGVMIEVKQEADELEDGAGERDEDQDNGESESEEEEMEAKVAKQLQPAWVDEDDAGEKVRIATRDPKKRKLQKQAGEQVISGAEYTQRLRERFEKINHQESGGPTWAKLPEDVDGASGDEDEEDILATAEALVGSSSQRLAPSILNVTRLKDANQREYSRGLHSVHFHPNAQLLLTGSEDKALRLFQIDGKKNPKVQGVIFKDTPIAKAWFSPDGREAVVTGRKPWLYIYDVVSGKVTKVWYPAGRGELSTERAFYSQDGKYLAFCGKAGCVHLTSNQTKQKITEFKMNNISRSVSFSPDGLSVYTAGGDAYVYQWDLRTHRCLHKFLDEGMSKTSSLAISPESSLHAVGSESGVVNVYSAETLATRPSAPKPQKALMNLQTSISHMKFNHDTQILGINSWVKTSSFRLVHLPSLTVFGNWPTERTPLGKVMDFDFSPHSGFLALGTHKGKVLLYRLNHYTSA